MSNFESLSKKINFFDFFFKLNFNLLKSINLNNCTMQNINSCRNITTHLQDKFFKIALMDEEINKLLEKEKINLTERELILLNLIFFS